MSNHRWAFPGPPIFLSTVDLIPYCYRSTLTNTVHLSRLKCSLLYTAIHRFFKISKISQVLRLDPLLPKGQGFRKYYNP